MTDLFLNILDWLALRDPILVYAFLVFNACFESLFPPYPSDAFVLVFSFLCGLGNFNPIAIFICTVVGSVSGMMILYEIGRNKGDSLIKLLSRTFIRKIFSVKMIDRAKARLSQRGDMISILNRFLPGMRAPLCFASGMVRLSPGKFFIYSTLSVVLWNLFLVVAGFYVGSTWHEASAFLRNYSIVAYIALITLLAVLAFLYFWKKRRIS